MKICKPSIYSNAGGGVVSLTSAGWEEEGATETKRNGRELAFVGDVESKGLCKSSIQPKLSDPST